MIGSRLKARVARLERQMQIENGSAVDLRLWQRRRAARQRLSEYRRKEDANKQEEEAA